MVEASTGKVGTENKLEMNVNGDVQQYCGAK